MKNLFRKFLALKCAVAFERTARNSALTYFSCLNSFSPDIGCIMFQFYNVAFLREKKLRLSRFTLPWAPISAEAFCIFSVSFKWLFKDIRRACFPSVNIIHDATFFFFSSFLSHQVFTVPEGAFFQKHTPTFTSAAKTEKCC